VVNIININLFLLYNNMFKNWFRSANEKRMEEQIAKLREDIILLQTQIIDLINRSVEEKTTTVETLFNVLEPREEVSNVVEQMVVSVVTPIIEEEPIVVEVVKPDVVVSVVTPIIEEEPTVVAVVEDKTIKEEPVVVVKEEKETNTAPKKRRQSKKAAQLEEALPK
jgi:hypothetical protein